MISFKGSENIPPAILRQRKFQGSVSAAGYAATRWKWFALLPTGSLWFTV
jgi:hypothetical protein